MLRPTESAIVWQRQFGLGTTSNSTDEAPVVEEALEVEQEGAGVGRDTGELRPPFRRPGD